jgi:hypothetical protein
MPQSWKKLPAFLLALSFFALALASSPAPLWASGLCYYNGNGFSLGACFGGQRCRVNANGEYYWSDDANCGSVQTSPGIGGKPQV